MNICYGNSITIYLNELPLYVDVDGKIKAGKKEPSIFQIRHQNPEISTGNPLLGGNAVKLYVGDVLCKIGNDGYIYCKPDAVGKENIRILDKHGQDKIPIVDDHYVKFRQPGYGIDCSLVPGKQALNAKIKKSWQYYGFTIHLVKQ